MLPTTPMAPRGSQTIPLALVMSHAEAEACSKDATADKWAILRAVETAARALGLPKSRVAVLDALLSFYPKQKLVAGEDLVVWPSNAKLALRAHVSTETITRSLNHLASAGLILRRDSPNCKRYARKGQGGAISQAFGFDLTPLVVKADELTETAADVTEREAERKHLRQSISVNQREIRTLLATAAAEQVPGDWTTYQADFVPISRQVPRSITFEAAAILAGALEQLVTKVRSCLVDHVERHKLTSTARHSDEHKQNSTPEPNSDFEPGFANGPGRPEEPHHEAKNPPYEAHYPLGMVLDACQNLGVYSTRPIASWSDFTATVETIRPYLGISPSAWDEAKETFGLRQAAVIVAAIHERSEAIKSAGGYLRALTRKARAGEFSLGPVLMALTRSNLPRAAERGRSPSQ
jgi:replication initiation protein RepC